MISNILYTACVNFFLLYMLQPWTKAEFYSSTAQMDALLKTHKRVVEGLDKYVMAEEKRMAVLKRHLRVYKFEHEKAMEDIPDYLENPINAFTLIKRLTIDLADIEHSNIIAIAHSADYIKNVRMSRDDVKYPTLEDLAGAAQALTRLQKTYQLDVHDLAEGVLNGVQGHPMTAADCFELARAVYNFTDYENTIAWSMEALRKFKKESNIELTITEPEIFEYIIISHAFLGNIKTALEWTYKLLELDPDHPEARSNILYFEKTIKRQEQKKWKQRNVVGELSKNYYEALCRDEVEVPSEITKRLSCRYVTEHHPFLRLAPIKVEQMYIKPDIYVFHEVISDEDIEFFQKMAFPMFQRATVRVEGTDGQQIVMGRVGQVAQAHNESKALARLSRRVEDMTGLSTRSAEPLQVVNYGIGGHYWPHCDFIKYHGVLNEEYQRIATVMFYMSEVAQGGATVFIELGLSVFPIKGAALFWTNLHPSGEGDMATLHAACPVLRGSKWVGIAWLRAYGQELLKPCNLDDQQEKTQNFPIGIPKTSSWLRRRNHITAEKPKA